MSSFSKSYVQWRSYFRNLHLVIILQDLNLVNKILGKEISKAIYFLDRQEHFRFLVKILTTSGTRVESGIVFFLVFKTILIIFFINPTESSANIFDVGWQVSVWCRSVWWTPQIPNWTIFTNKNVQKTVGRKNEFQLMVVEVILHVG